MTDVGAIVFDAMLKEAVTANFHNKMRAMPPEEELLRKYPPSAEHICKMNSLFLQERRRETIKIRLNYAKVAVFILCLASTILFSILMFNPQVRAVVRDAIVQFFDGFARIEYNEPDETPKTAQSFTPGYLPEGYELIKTEEYGDNCFVIYEDADGNRLMLNISPADSHMGDTDNRVYRTEIHEGVTYHIFEAHDADDYSTITWSKEGFMFSLTGAVPLEELMNTAHSLE